MLAWQNSEHHRLVSDFPWPRHVIDNAITLVKKPTPSDVVEDIDWVNKQFTCWRSDCSKIAPTSLFFHIYMSECFITPSIICSISTIMECFCPNHQLTSPLNEKDLEKSRLVNPSVSPYSMLCCVCTALALPMSHLGASQSESNNTEMRLLWPHRTD